MGVLGLAGLGSTGRPEAGDSFVATDLAGESNEAVDKDDENQKEKSNKEPDDNSNTTKPVNDAKNNTSGVPHRTPIDSIKPGTIYYNSRLGLKFVKDKDGGSSLSEGAAKDTLP